MEADQNNASDEDEEGRTCENPSSPWMAKRVAEDGTFRPLGPAPVPVPLSAAELRKRLSPSPHLASRQTAVRRYRNCSLVAGAVGRKARIERNVRRATKTD